MKGVVSQPLLRNPERWLLKNKYIGPGSCSTSFYDRNTFFSDPYVGMLCSGYGTDMRSRVVFPRGQMVRLTVDEQLANKVSIRPSVTMNDPVARKMDNGYILNNYWYVLYSIFSGQWKRFIPPLYRTKASKMALKNVDIEDKLHEVIAKEYIESIREEYENKGVSCLKEGEMESKEIDLEVRETGSKQIDLQVRETGSKQIDLQVRETQFTEITSLKIKLHGKSNELLTLQLDSLPSGPREALKDILKQDVNIPINTENKRLLRNIALLFNYYCR